MARTHIPGFPRVGARRELKFALEAFWRGESDAPALEAAGRTLRDAHWTLQERAGIDWLAAGDFRFYDAMLDLTVGLGAIPERFGFDASKLTAAQYFELARGNRAQPAMEMTKWFDTNYHYLLPELGPGTRFEGRAERFFADVAEALSRGRPVK